MKFLARVILIKGRNDFEIEAESTEEAKEKFRQLAESTDGGLQLLVPPPGQDVYIEIRPVTDVAPDIKLVEGQNNE